MSKRQRIGGERATVIYSSGGVAPLIGKSESRARQYFESGRIPTEYMVNGKRPAVSSETLAKIASEL